MLTELKTLKALNTEQFYNYFALRGNCTKNRKKSKIINNE